MSPRLDAAADRVVVAMGECEARFAAVRAEIERQRVADAEQAAAFHREAERFQADAAAALATYNART